MLALTLIPLLLTGALLSAFGVFGGDDDDDAKTAQSTEPSEGDDLLIGTEGDDEINGKGGDDAILGGEGDDTIYGREGSDFVFGDEGDDSLRGGEGNDDLIDLVGSDTLIGGSGVDLVIASGMPSNVATWTEQAQSGQFEDSPAPWDFAEGDFDGDEVYLGKGNDFAEVGYNDTVTGGEGFDTFMIIGAQGDLGDHDAPEITDFDIEEDALVVYYSGAAVPELGYAVNAGGTVDVLADGQTAATLANMTSLDAVAAISVSFIEVYTS